MLRLAQLELDARNPRFGGLANSNASQKSVLSHIVENFSIADVIASLAVNGYFAAEPLIGRRNDGTDDSYTIVEGNRRLAACLVLSGDPRAEGYERLAIDASGRGPRAIWRENNSPSIDPVPVICFEPDDSGKELLSYLGVRHISASAPWDSYAKAAWVHQVVSSSRLSVEEVATMIGDKHKTVSRLLEGFYIVNQATNAGEFRPSDSVKRGRGSVSSYPFSWVYTLLGYQATRQFLGLGDLSPHENPIANGKLDRVGIVMRAMFGSSAGGRASAVGDSRQLGDLASILVSQEKVALLEQGKSVAEIVRTNRPIGDRLRSGLADIRTIQQELVTGMDETPLNSSEALEHISAAQINQRVSGSIVKRLESSVSGNDG